MAPLKIAVLDDYQDISKAHFEALSPPRYEVSYFPDTLLPYNHPDTPEDVKEALVRRLEPFTVICGMRERTPFPGALLSRLPNLKLLLNTARRNRSLDLDACKERGIVVAGTETTHPPGTPDSTTQHCVAMILALARNLVQDDINMKAGLWQTGLATGLSGKVFGAVGLGRIGAAVARIMHLAFGMKIIAWSENLTQEKADEAARSAGLPVEDTEGGRTFRAVRREELYSTSDVVSIHLVLSERSRGLVTGTDLGMMKRSAFFVNTGRGPIVVEKDLLHVLKEGRIRGAAVDVFNSEPLEKDSEWRTVKWGQDGRSKVLITPHMAYVEEDQMNGSYRQQVQNILRWERGEEVTVRLA